MELPLPSGVTYSCTSRQVFWLSDQPEEVSLPTGVFYQPPAVAGLRLNFLRPRLQRRDRPGFAPGSGLPGGFIFLQYKVTCGAHNVNLSPVDFPAVAHLYQENDSLCFLDFKEDAVISGAATKKAFVFRQFGHPLWSRILCQGIQVRL